tara:strand:- start:207 stop:497 length:291 start_codon:yes stop_codon:yes gene_type:complete
MRQKVSNKAIILHERLMSMGVEDAMTMDGFDDCAIGVLERSGMKRIVVYDKEKVIEKLMDGGIPTYDGALDFYEYNQLGTCLGDNSAPGFLTSLVE